MNAPVAPGVIETLRKFDSATIANVIELFEIRSRVAGYTGPKIKALYPELPPAVGTVVTATFRSGYPAAQADVYSGMSQILAAGQSIPGPKWIVFQDLDEPSRAATYGEVMTSSLQGFGFIGLITSGTARDIEQVRALKFPCFASGTIVSHGYCRILEVNVPVQVDGMEIRPGELLHADANGIIDIPVPLAEEIARLCQPFVDAENLIINYVRGKSPTVDGYNDASNKAHARYKELGEQARAARDRIMGK